MIQTPNRLALPKALIEQQELLQKIFYEAFVTRESFAMLAVSSIGLLVNKNSQYPLLFVDVSSFSKDEPDLIRARSIAESCVEVARSHGIQLTNARFIGHKGGNGEYIPQYKKYKFVYELGSKDINQYRSGV